MNIPNLKGCRGISLTDVIAVIGIFAVVVPVVFESTPAQMRERNQQNDDQIVCESNLKQLGLGLIQYCQDYDENYPEAAKAYPVVTTDQKAKDKSGDLVNLGWAGMIYPYIKSSAVYLCPSDSSVDPDIENPANVVPVSYAINSNLVGSPIAEWNSPANTVALYEIFGDQANVNDDDEDRYEGAQQLSPSGDGVIDETANMAAPMKQTFMHPSIACGAIDNTMPSTSSLYRPSTAQSGRHLGGGNFLATDGHVKWMFAQNVSAGGNALKPDNLQSRAGCTSNIGSSSTVPCAEGTAVPGHNLTFSYK